MKSLTDSLYVLGQTLLNILHNRLDDELSRRYFERVNETICKQAFCNTWHTPEFTRHALHEIGLSLSSQINVPNQLTEDTGKHIAVVHTGITPLNGFDDLLAITLNGHRYTGRLSQQDKLMIPLIAELLISIEPRWKSLIEFSDRLPKADCIIATDNGNQTFNDYLNTRPHILHKKKHNIAIITSHETDEELRSLAYELLLYFGMGEQALSKIYFPQNYDLSALFQIMENIMPDIATHHQYLNHLEYQKTLLLMNQVPFLDAGIMAFVNSSEIESPLAVTYTEPYSSLQTLSQQLENSIPNIGYVTCKSAQVPHWCPLGHGHKFSLNTVLTQQPFPTLSITN